jgi:hypothetical protein
MFALPIFGIASSRGLGLEVESAIVCVDNIVSISYNYLWAIDGLEGR